MKSMSDFWVGIFVFLGIISIVFLSFRVGSYNSFDKKMHIVLLPSLKI